ncbi:MAG: phycobilisome linker polypeptide [Cyanobacteria bacterium J06597_16]
MEIAGQRRPGYPSIRHSNRVLIVSYEALSETLQRINKSGGRIANISKAA